MNNLTPSASTLAKSAINWPLRDSAPVTLTTPSGLVVEYHSGPRVQSVRLVSGGTKLTMWKHTGTMPWKFRAALKTIWEAMGHGD